MDPRKSEADDEDRRLNRLDLFFLTLITVGLGLGACYVWLEWGWEHALAYTAVVCVAVGVIGGMRR